MAFKPLKSFKGQTNKIEYDIKRAYGKLDCASCEPDGDNHLRLKKITKHNNISLVQSAIDGLMLNELEEFDAHNSIIEWALESNLGD